MSSFEYVSVLASIIVGFAISDMLRSLQMLLRARRKVKWDWALPLLAVLVLMSIVMVWWLLYEPVARPITIGEFLPLLVELVLLSLLASAVFPDEIGEGGVDLKAYYDDNAGLIWLLFAAAVGWLSAIDVAQRLGAGERASAALTEQLVEIFIFAVMVSLAFVRKRWWHAIGFAILASGPIFWVSRSLG